MNQLEEIRAYWNTRAAGYSKSIQEELEAEKQNWKEKFQEVLLKCEGNSVLDVGCGPGFFSMILADMGCQVTAVDYSDEMLEKAKMNVEATEGTATFLQADAQNLPFADNSFDMLVSRNLTWNLERPEKAYAEWIRVLKPGGCLLNFDGNYYLHYYNKEYEKAKEKEQYKNGQGHKYMDGVDVHIIDEIARDLPLSKEERPRWDMEALLNLHVQELRVSVNWKSYEEGGEDYKIVPSFMIKAVK